MNLLFDLDGTLTDPYKGITKCISHALHSLGRQAPPCQDLRWCIGPPLKTSFTELLNLNDEDDSLAEEALRLYRERFSSIGIYENRVFEEIPYVLKQLSDFGHVLYVATAKPTIFAKKILEYFELHCFFKEIYGSELDGTRSDKTDLIAYILKRESITGADACMIGDRKHDIVGARNNELLSVAVGWGYGSREELEQSGSDMYLSSPRDLVDYLNRELT